ncbi:hypothetical protein SynBIOSU31_03329 [Synechococcus sp. BIOS-U3-1]|nr:hypothetical protein SynBIOSU31_03329 [Synechococcus sp. BIOS-U3-1]
MNSAANESETSVESRLATEPQTEINSKENRDFIHTPHLAH